MIVVRGSHDDSGCVLRSLAEPTRLIAQCFASADMSAVVVGFTQTPSTGLRHPSLEEGAGKRCWKCGFYLVTVSCILTVMTSVARQIVKLRNFVANQIVCDEFCCQLNCL